MSTRWRIRKDASLAPYPWTYTLTDEDECGAGGHYGSLESFDRALSAVASEAADHAERMRGRE